MQDCITLTFVRIPSPPVQKHPPSGSFVVFAQLDRLVLLQRTVAVDYVNGTAVPMTTHTKRNATWNETVHTPTESPQLYPTVHHRPHHKRPRLPKTLISTAVLVLIDEPNSERRVHVSGHTPYRNQTEYLSIWILYIFHRIILNLHAYTDN